MWVCLGWMGCVGWVAVCIQVCEASRTTKVWSKCGALGIATAICLSSHSITNSPCVTMHPLVAFTG